LRNGHGNEFGSVGNVQDLAEAKLWYQKWCKAQGVKLTIKGMRSRTKNTHSFTLNPWLKCLRWIELILSFGYRNTTKTKV